MQRASAAFGLLIFALWLGVLAVGLAYVTVWAATQRRPQWRILGLLKEPAPVVRAPRRDVSGGAQVISFDREAAERRRKRP